RCDPLHRRQATLLLDVGDDDLRPLGREGDRDGLTDAAPGTGDERDAIREQHGSPFRAFARRQTATDLDGSVNRRGPERIHTYMERAVHPLMRIPVPWVFVLAYFIGLGLQRAIPIEIRPMELVAVSRGAGVALLAAGAALAAWSLRIFVKLGTTTVPFEKSSHLVTWGPYRFSRNPMYVSLTLLYLGEAGVLAQIWPLAPLTLTLAYLNGIVIPFEESTLRQVFGAAYDEY